MIQYKTNKNIPNQSLYELFLAVGWSDASATTEDMIAHFNKPFLGSTIAISAWDDDRLVGCIRALSDGMFRSVIYDLAVLPDYQGQGIGSVLVKRCIAIYPDSEWVLETTPDRVSFYEFLGFQLNSAPHLRIPCKWF